jgi:hypothetical protein
MVKAKPLRSVFGTGVANIVNDRSPRTNPTGSATDSASKLPHKTGRKNSSDGISSLGWGLVSDQAGHSIWSDAHGAVEPSRPCIPNKNSPELARHLVPVPGASTSSHMIPMRAMASAILVQFSSKWRMRSDGICPTIVPGELVKRYVNQTFSMIGFWRAFLRASSTALGPRDGRPSRLIRRIS